jgi:predicted RNA-binding protein associated with RNAse of E/G family
MAAELSLRSRSAAPADAGDRHVHPPKTEIFDLADMTNTDPKGFVRRVDEYRIEPFGLFMARPVVGHRRLSYIESWLLPRQGLRVTRQSFHPGAERDYDFYVDVANISVEGDRWRTVDHYLDLLVRTGDWVELLDVDELIAAVTEGLLSAGEAEHALQNAYRAVAGIAAHDHDLNRWLAEQGVRLAWRRKG